MDQDMNRTIRFIPAQVSHAVSHPRFRFRRNA